MFGAGGGIGQNAGGLGDTGTAARFFYTAKASKDDRNDGLHDYDHTDAADMVDREPGSRRHELAHELERAEHQAPRITIPPSSPPRSCATWCRLVTPKGGLVLDPFAGSGTTLDRRLP